MLRYAVLYPAQGEATCQTLASLMERFIYNMDRFLILLLDFEHLLLLSCLVSPHWWIIRRRREQIVQVQPPFLLLSRSAAPGSPVLNGWLPAYVGPPTLCWQTEYRIQWQQLINIQLRDQSRNTNLSEQRNKSIEQPIKEITLYSWTASICDIRLLILCTPVDFVHSLTQQANQHQ